MILKSPFEIGPRLTPSLRITDGTQTAWISYDKGKFIMDLPDGTKHLIRNYRSGLSASNHLQLKFADILCFLSACAESRKYAESKGKNAMSGENSNLFPDNVGRWAQHLSDEISMLQYEIEESKENLIIDN